MYPCRDCRMAEDCSIREEKRRAVRGLKLTSIKFICRARIDDLRPGMRVKATLPYVCVGIAKPYQDEPYAITEERTLDAVVMAWIHGKVRIYVPKQANGFLSKNGEEILDVVSVPARYLVPTGENAVACIHCGLPKEAKALRWKCRMNYDGSEVADCEFAELKTSNGTPESQNTMPEATKK